MTLKLVGSDDSEPRDNPPRTARPSKWRPRTAAFAVFLIILLAVLPLLLTSPTNHSAWIALGGVLAVVLVFAFVIRRTDAALDLKAAAERAPKCRLCGSSSDEHATQVVKTGVRRCPECGSSIAN